MVSHNPIGLGYSLAVAIELNHARALAIAMSAQSMCPLWGLGSTSVAIDPKFFNAISEFSMGTSSSAAQ